MKNRITEEEYREAAIIWRKENPTSKSIPIKTTVIIENGKEINLGRRMGNMRTHMDNLTEEQKEFWKAYGLYEEYPTEAEYREAAMIWRKENPTLTSIPTKTVVKIENGKEITLGTRMGNLRNRINTLTEEQKEFWKEYGLYDGYPTEEEYQEAAKIWKRENPTLTSIPTKTVVKIENGKEITLGTRMYTMRRDIDKLTKEQKEFWKVYGLYDGYPTEEEYQEAAKIWKRENPTLTSIPTKTVVKIENGKEITLGRRMKTMRRNIDKLTEEQKEFWKAYGLYEGKYLPTEEEYQEAAKIWRKENPILKSISVKTVVKIENGKEINIGTRMHNMRTHIDKLTEEQKKFWKEYGLYEEYPTEEEYREAAMIWRKENPTLTNIPTKTVVKIENGKEIHLGTRMGNLRNRINTLTEEQKEFWKEYGLYDGYPTEEEYQEAAIIWKRENPTLTSIPTKTVVKIENGKEINIGRRMNTMRHDIDKLTEEQKEFWKAYGLYDGYPTEEEYQEAAKIWKRENSTLTSIPTKTVVKIENGKEINIGRRMKTMRRDIDTLTEEQKEFWKAYGLYEKNKRGKREQNPRNNRKSSRNEQSKVQDRIVSIALQVSKKYNIPFSDLLFMYESLREYEQLDVGLEEDYEKKIQKIKEYHFDEMDVEESYFLALSFKQSVLEKKQKEWWQRNELLRQYILDWNYYSEEEKKEETKIQNFTPEELEFINRSREEIDALLHSLKI